jgi:mRNA interferase MazF
MRRGDVYLASLDPAIGHEQQGRRPVLVFQNDVLNAAATTVLIIPFTTTLRRASLPSCLLVRQGDGGLTSDSVALCHQMRVLDASRLTTRLGTLAPTTMAAISRVVVFTLGI